MGLLPSWTYRVCALELVAALDAQGHVCRIEASHADRGRVEGYNGQAARIAGTFRGRLIIKRISRSYYEMDDFPDRPVTHLWSSRGSWRG